MSTPISRRLAIEQIVATLAAPLLLGALRPRAPGPRHPDPRPGISAEHVLPDDQVDAAHKDAYDSARQIPEVLDGIYCHCDCADRHSNLRSLLSCYETEMPMSCGVCSGEARMALRLHDQGKSLAEIRAAIDKRFG